MNIFPRFIFAIMIIYQMADGATIAEELETIFLRLYIGRTMDEYIDYSLENSSILQTKLIENRPTILYIHGFTENLESESVRMVIQAYLNRNDHNVIGLDYGNLANATYTKVVRNIGAIGTMLATSLDKMVQSGFDPEKFHIVGHSMGAQIAGNTGRKMNFKISRITALDPAGPLFNILEPRLISSDARFVDIIHTDYGFYGIGRITGTVDFFPNGGSRIQPGCPQNSTFYSSEEFCSHNRSWRYYAESLSNKSAFLGVQCPSMSHFYSSECNSNEQVIMGYATPYSAKGNVYLRTNTQSPFGMQEKGAKVV